MVAKVSRNDPCPCGTGKKYKKCCAQPKPSKHLYSRNVRCLTSEQGSGGRVFSALASIQASGVSTVDADANDLSKRISKGS